MRPIAVGDFAARSGGSVAGIDPAAMIRGFALDNREVKAGDLFIAIRGERVDGHQFVTGALEAGAVAALVERPVEGPHILVADVVEALALFAKSKREEFFGPVVGITGSAGKTSTKEFLAAALSPLGRVLKNQGNRNTEFTSPLVWAELEPDHRAAVIEMSMRGFHQVEHLAAFSRPTIGIVTNIGDAHAEMVGSREGIARAKAELLESLPINGHAIVWAEDDFVDVLKSRSRAPVQTFGFSETANCRVTRYTPVSWTECLVEGVLGGQSWSATLSSVGQHMALNAAAAILAASCAGVAVPAAAISLRTAVLPPMRMEVRHLNGATIVLDNYNASPPSMLAAIETLAELPAEGRRLAVIGEMRELGEQSLEGHKAVGVALAEHHLDEVILVGSATEACKAECLAGGMSNVRMAADQAEVTDFLRGIKPGDVVLVKGSRALELEKALEPLMEAVS